MKCVAVLIEYSDLSAPHAMLRRACLGAIRVE